MRASNASVIRASSILEQEPHTCPGNHEHYFSVVPTLDRGLTAPPYSLSEKETGRDHFPHFS